MPMAGMMAMSNATPIIPIIIETKGSPKTAFWEGGLLFFRLVKAFHFMHDLHQGRQFRFAFVL